MNNDSQGNDKINCHARLAIAPVCREDIDALFPLVDEFISDHRALCFRKHFRHTFREWIRMLLKDENALVSAAKIDGELIGVTVGILQDNGPLLSPERIGYVSIMVVASKFRRIGVGNSLWNCMKEWFLSKGVRDVELYTQSGNDPAAAFWASKGFGVFLERRRLHIP